MTVTRSSKTGGRPSLVDLATEKIRDRILDLTLSPGSQINENVLKHRLGISRTPAREALSRLVTEGLVENARGFFVSPLDLRETAQFYDAYIIVERSSAVLCRFANSGFARDLRDIQKRLSRSIEKNAFLDITKHNADFHLRFAEATENSFVYEHAVRIHNLARRLAFFVYANESDDESYFRTQQDAVVSEHEQMIACVEEADREGLVTMTATHAGRVRVRIANFIAGHPPETFANIVNDGGPRRRGKNTATVIAIEGGKP